MALLDEKIVAILATHGFEQSELMRPLQALRDVGATVHVISPEDGEIRGWDGDDWGDSVPVDRKLSEAKAEDYNALVLPGGQINPDILRANPDAVAFVQNFWDAGLPIAAICHAPWLLVEAGVAKGLKMTSYNSIATDVKNAGAEWVDEEVVTDRGVTTSRNPGDLDAFCEKVIEEIREGRHERRAA